MIANKKIKTTLEMIQLGRDHGITPAALQTLLTILDIGDAESMMPSEIARRSGMTSAAITGSLDRLQSLGMVERRGVAEDRRVLLARPTALAFTIFLTHQP